MSRTKLKKINRMGNCPCQICNAARPLVEHHLNGRITNHINNLVFVCSNCHEDIHMETIIIEGWFITSCGKELIWRYASEESITNLKTNPPLYRGN